MNIELLDHVDSGTADEMLASQATGECSGNTIHQHPDWASINKVSGYQKYLHFIARDEAGKIQSAGLIRLTSIGKIRSVAAIKRGPITTRPENLASVLPPLEAALRDRGVVTLAVNPHWTDDLRAAARRELEKLGYVTVPRKMQTLPTATAMIDLTPPEDEMFSNLASSLRRKIRKSDKLGIDISDMTTADEAAEVHVIMRQMAKTTGMETDAQHDPLNHFEVFKRRPDLGIIKVARFEGKIFGGAITHVEGPRAYSHLVATAPDQVTIPRSEKLIWEMMLAAKERGCTKFDLVGYPDDEFESDEGGMSRGNFKDRFHPRIEKILPIMEKPLRPMEHKVIQSARTLYRTSPVRSHLKRLLRAI